MVEACVVVVNVVALVLAIVGSSVYGGGDVTMGEFLIWLSLLLSSGSSSELSDGAFFRFFEWWKVFVYWRQSFGFFKDFF